MRLITPFVLGLAALLVPTCAQGQVPPTTVKPPYKMQITTDRPEAIYKPDEGATLPVQLLRGNHHRGCAKHERWRYEPRASRNEELENA
jgi:hypothetical protein